MALPTLYILLNGALRGSFARLFLSQESVRKSNSSYCVGYTNIAAPQQAVYVRGVFCDPNLRGTLKTQTCFIIFAWLESLLQTVSSWG